MEASWRAWGPAAWGTQRWMLLGLLGGEHTRRLGRDHTAAAVAVVCFSVLFWVAYRSILQCCLQDSPCRLNNIAATLACQRHPHHPPLRCRSPMHLQGGDVVCCDGCRAVYHLACINMESLPEDDFFCPQCSCKECGTACTDHHPAASVLCDTVPVHTRALQVRCLSCREPSILAHTARPSIHNRHALGAYGLPPAAKTVPGQQAACWPWLRVSPAVEAVAAAAAHGPPGEWQHRQQPAATACCRPRQRAGGRQTSRA